MIHQPWCHESAVACQLLYHSTLSLVHTTVDLSPLNTIQLILFLYPQISILANSSVCLCPSIIPTVFKNWLSFFFFFKQWNTTSLSGYYISKWAHITLASLFILYFSICSAPLCSNIILTFKLCLKFTRVIVCTKNYLHCLDVMTTATKKKPKKNKQKQLLNLHYQ